ncbi:hypothetical protein GOODEAATRI_002269 [Goodea atripinnis]|uniref:Uncharacterized protein n=1 Tax=Goodea atripinnis TaxID=208336 RepID=A0ABV0PAQ9_9TELE
MHCSEVRSQQRQIKVFSWRFNHQYCQHFFSTTNPAPIRQKAEEKQAICEPSTPPSPEVFIPSTLSRRREEQKERTHGQLAGGSTTIDQLHFQAHLYYRSAHQIRTVHQAVPRVADTWRDCMSPENENRCRQVLQANWKLYDMEKVRTGARQTQGKNKGKWASILVSLCYNEGGPAFLFTLRSSTLKGRHKGDVSPQNRGYTHFRSGDKHGYTLPVFNNGKHRVWGLTAVALDHTLKLIIPPYSSVTEMFNS